MRVSNRTIGDATAVGFCGSGIVDTVAEMYRNQIIDRRGRLQRNVPDVRKNDHGFELVLVPGERSGTGRDIVMTQKDVNEIQCKGTIATGLETLLEATHTPPEEIKEVVIAGAFGQSSIWTAP